MTDTTSTKNRSARRRGARQCTGMKGSPGLPGLPMCEAHFASVTEYDITEVCHRSRGRPVIRCPILA